MRQPHSERVALQMVDGNERFATGRRQRFAQHQPHHHPADEAGAGSGRNRIHLIQRQASVAKRLGIQPINLREVGASGNFRHHATIGRVVIALGGQGLRQNFAIFAHQRHRRFVAARFNAKNNTHAKTFYFVIPAKAGILGLRSPLLRG